MRLMALYIILLLGAQQAVWAQTLDLDALLQRVKASQGIEGKINREREARFLAEKEKQQALLAEARDELAQLEKASQALKASFETNETELLELETQLQERSGVLGELFGVVRQVAGDLKADLDQSLVSAQYPGRSESIQKIADSKTMPTIEQLEALWYTLQQEMTESGKVVEFPATVLTAAGEPRKAQVIRIGAFNALADGRYLRYLPESGQLIELARQPDSRYLALAEDFKGSGGELAKIAIDPTRGVILGMLVQTPDVFERVQQGGAIGYIILALGALGMIIVLARMAILAVTERRMRKQLNDIGTIDTRNPLGRVLAVSREAAADPSENLEALLDEAILREAPKLERGQSLVKLLTAVAPLLGLLGTVTGMIATFQSISLFGSGDPKLMASGISQALVTTMLGLMVAIPLLFLHSLMASRSKSLVQILEEQSAGLISRMVEKRGSPPHLTKVRGL